MAESTTALGRSSNPFVRWLLAGPAEDLRYLAFLRRRIERRGLGDRVHLLGYRSDPDALLAASDVLALPSVEHERLDLDDGLPPLEVRGNEGFPLSVLEAFAQGVPVVASRVAGVAEQVDDGRTGHLVPPADVEALAAALARIAGDPGWREEAGRQARQAVATRFSVEGVTRSRWHSSSSGPPPPRCLLPRGRPRSPSAAASP